MTLDLLVFDLDGTLIDSKYDLLDALNYTAKQLGHSTFTDAQIPQMVGNGVRALITQAFNLTTDSPALKEAQTIMMDYYRQNLCTRTVFYDGVLETLKSLNNVKKAVLSNKPDEFTQRIIQELGLSSLFDQVLGATNYFDRKPSGESLEHFLKELNIAPNRAMMIGDGDADVLAGKNAGMYTCAVTYGYRSKTELEILHPDYIIESFSELPTLLQ